jgi:hypothetical protein
VEVESLLVLAADFVERGEPLPSSMREIVAHFLRLPKRRPLRIRKGMTRDYVVASAIAAVVAGTGLKPTRNKTQRLKEGTPSACLIVADALANQKISLSEDAVEKIWTAKQRSKRFPGSGNGRTWGPERMTPSCRKAA